MPQSPEDKRAYWIKRMIDHIISFTRPYEDLKTDIQATVRHIDADPTQINKFLNRIEIEFQNLVIAVEGLKPTVKAKKEITKEAVDTGELQHGKVA